MTDGSLNPGGRGRETFSYRRIKLLGDRVHGSGVQQGQNDGFPQIVITFDMGRHADIMENIGDHDFQLLNRDEILSGSGVLNGIFTAKRVNAFQKQGKLYRLEHVVAVHLFCQCLFDKSVVKRSPDEPVGVFCKKDGKPGVIEYRELPTEMAHEVDEEGELLFGQSHIMCNLYSFEALEKISKEKLPYHSANKKAPYMNEMGEITKKLYDTLTGIQLGRIEAPEGWIKVIE